MIGKLKNRLKTGEILLGTFVKMSAINTIEILGELKYHFVVLDMEHSPLGFESVEKMVIVADQSGLGTIIRIPDRQEYFVVRALDLGCDGVQVPFIENPSEAKKVVEAGRYHPMGNRSLSLATRGARYGLIGYGRHTIDSNQNQIIAVQIESWEAVQQSEAIAATEGIDVLFIGPADLSQSLGITGQVSSPKITEALEITGRAAKKYGKALGIHVSSPADAEKALRCGATYLAYSTDIGLFLKGAESALAGIAGLLGK
jgi:4-hydroxy-2-oxoheptanedioate aldolase